MLTWPGARGTWTRHASNGAGVTGATVDSGLVTSAAESEMENMRAEGVESPGSDTAQQLSACVCVTTRSGREPSTEDPCIGQLPPSVQQSMRASGVNCQPAHPVQPAAPSVRTATSAAARLSSLATRIGCMTPTRVSNVMSTVLPTFKVQHAGDSDVADARTQRSSAPKVAQPMRNILFASRGHVRDRSSPPGRHAPSSSGVYSVSNVAALMAYASEPSLLFDTT